MTRAQVEAHQRKHGFTIHQDPVVEPRKRAGTGISPAMNNTEREFSFMLEVQKREGKILRWQFQGIKLAWGVDPDTGKPMWYTPDFFVVLDDIEGDTCRGAPYSKIFKVIEVKGPHIHYRQQAMARFKGCRSDWPEFRFEMWQKAGGTWTRLF